MFQLYEKGCAGAGGEGFNLFRGREGEGRGNPLCTDEEIPVSFCRVNVIKQFCLKANNILGIYWNEALKNYGIE